jgi:hypothetical protein
MLWGLPLTKLQGVWSGQSTMFPYVAPLGACSSCSGGCSSGFGSNSRRVTPSGTPIAFQCMR